MDFGDHVPPNVYSKSVLLKCKQQFTDHFLGIANKYPINSLIELKHRKYSGSIHTIIADKLFVHYWSLSQLVVYKHIKKIIRPVIASGSWVKKIKRTK